MKKICGIFEWIWYVSLYWVLVSLDLVVVFNKFVLLYCKIYYEYWYYERLINLLSIISYIRWSKNKEKECVGLNLFLIVV